MKQGTHHKLESIQKISDTKRAQAQFGKESATWSGDSARYVAVHLRMRRANPNPVCKQRDIECQGKVEFALLHDIPHEMLRVDSYSDLKYSINPRHYITLCILHHKRYDKPWKGQQ